MKEKPEGRLTSVAEAGIGAGAGWRAFWNYSSPPPNRNCYKGPATLESDCHSLQLFFILQNRNPGAYTLRISHYHHNPLSESLRLAETINLIAEHGYCLPDEP